MVVAGMVGRTWYNVPSPPLKTIWMVTLEPSLTFEDDPRLNGKQNSPSPCIWKNGTTCEKLLNEVGF